jgi:mono/diheme cytochrome c family protein
MSWRKATSRAQPKPRRHRRSPPNSWRAARSDGIIVAHGFPAPPSYYLDRLEAAPAQHFYDVMSNGYGVMFSYADRVEPHDRWAIAAYIRALQLSRHASAADVPDAAEHLQ